MRKKLAVDGKVKIDISCLPDEILSLIFQYCGPPWKEVPSKLMLVWPLAVVFFAKHI